MEHKTQFLLGYRFEVLAPAVFGIFFIITIGCGTGGVVNSTGGNDADQMAVLQALEQEPFFTESLTDTDEDQESAEAAGAQVYSGALPLESLAAESSTVVLPLFWWRGQLVRLNREIDIHIEDGTAEVHVVCYVAGTFFTADAADNVLVLWGKPFEDRISRNAVFEKNPWGWVLTAISPVEIATASTDQRTVSIEAVRAYVGSEPVWEATDPAALYSTIQGIPTFSPGDEIRIETEVLNSSTAGWTPGEFVFLHRPGHHITGRKTRDLMYDDGTHGDISAGDGIYTRTYTVGPCLGRHFAAVDVIDAGTFAEQASPVITTAWGMPYTVQ
jgi:hypothetical protein